MSPPRAKEPKEKDNEQTEKFYAVILHPDGDFKVESYSDLAGLVARLKALVDRDVSVFSFSGVQLKISKPPFRHLLTPWGPQPLFDVPSDSLEADDTGYMGADAAHLAPPPVLKSPDVSRALSPDVDEFFDDGNNETGLGVFDSVLPDPDS
jgi:hypothetical protein